MSPRAIVLLPLMTPLALNGLHAGRAATIQTKAPYALLVDYNTGAVLFEKKADAPVAPASTTKILTAEIVFRELAEGGLHLGDRMPISRKAAREGLGSSRAPRSSGASRPFKPNENPGDYFRQLRLNILLVLHPRPIVA
jgi:D-alanyl-D-alanine carboxypeptidase